jgi:hypothetical protein
MKPMQVRATGKPGVLELREIPDPASPANSARNLARLAYLRQHGPNMKETGKCHFIQL